MIKIEGETGLMLEPIIADVQKKHKLPRYKAIAYCIKALLLCADSDDFALYVDKLYLAGGDPLLLAALEK